MVHRGADDAIFFPAQEDIKEGELSVRLLLHRELYARVDTIQMAVKGVNQVRGSVVHVSSTYLLQNCDGLWKVDGASCSTSSITRFATTTDTGDPIAVPWICRSTLPSKTR